jgi:hypothetical protein
MHDKDDLDLLIDGALETYANPAPNDYLEDRMLQAVRIQIANQPAPSHLRWLSWSAALAAACLLFLIFFNQRQSTTPADSANDPTTAGIPHQQTPVETKSPTPISGGHIAQTPHSSTGTHANPPASVENAKADPLPKQDIFPAPVPLDEQVEALAFFIRKAPPSEVKQLLQAQAQADAPLAFKELEIPPLQPLDEGGK